MRGCIVSVVVPDRWNPQSLAEGRPYSRMNSVTVHTSDSPSTAKPPAQADQPAAAALSGPSGPLPVITCDLAPSEVLARLLALAKRGKLAGYAALGRHPRGLPGAAFRVSAFGQPYDRELIACVTPTTTQQGGEGQVGSRIEFESRLLRKLPAAVVVMVVLSIQPGLWLTDSMLRLYFSWYRIETWWWYLPLVLLSVPVLWKQFRRSEAAAHEDALRAIQQIREALTSPSGG